MMLYHLPCVLEAHVLLWISFDHGCDLERERFFCGYSIGIRTWQ